MPQEEIGKKQDQTDQISTCFQNRGLFSGHFLQTRLPEWKEWKVDAEIGPFCPAIGVHSIDFAGQDLVKSFS